MIYVFVPIFHLALETMGVVVDVGSPWYLPPAMISRWRLGFQGRTPGHRRPWKLGKQLISICKSKKKTKSDLDRLSNMFEIIWKNFKCEITWKPDTLCSNWSQNSISYMIVYEFLIIISIWSTNQFLLFTSDGRCFLSVKTCWDHLLPRIYRIWRKIVVAHLRKVP